MSDSANTADMTNNHAPESGDTATLPAEEAATPAPSKRRLESRRRILAAARQLFVERGYHGTRPQDISKAAGVGHGTFYLHFADKLDCFLSFAEEASNELEMFGEQHHTREAQTLEEGIRDILNVIFEYSEENPGVLAAAMTDINVLATEEMDKPMPDERWAEQWGDNVREWQQKGEIASDIDPLFAGHVLLGMIRQVGSYAARADVTREQVLEQLTKAMLRALTD